MKKNYIVKEALPEFMEYLAEVALEELDKIYISMEIIKYGDDPQITVAVNSRKDWSRITEKTYKIIEGVSDGFDARRDLVDSAIKEIDSAPDVEDEDVETEENPF